MSDTKILQAILDGQVQIRKDIKYVEEKLSKKIDKNGSRINKLGLQIAELEDGAPTVDEFDQLVERVDKVEKKVATFQ
ncbi:hypothetical protein IPM62_04035 [Candidatus Woesebacteria bacterium]|nr:MAG: hypothetical protein IPM62_04035 [Candidatus Woesebacteria bacterium]